jgi:hypothetical protein
VCASRSLPTPPQAKADAAAAAAATGAQHHAGVLSALHPHHQQQQQRQHGRQQKAACSGAGGYAQPFWRQLVECSRRLYGAYWQMPAYNLLRLLMTAACALVYGTM